MNASAKPSSAYLRTGIRIAKTAFVWLPALVTSPALAAPEDGSGTLLRVSELIDFNGNAEVCQDAAFSALCEASQQAIVERLSGARQVLREASLPGAGDGSPSSTSQAEALSRAKKLRDLKAEEVARIRATISKSYDELGQLVEKNLQVVAARAASGQTEFNLAIAGSVEGNLSPDELRGLAIRGAPQDQGVAHQLYSVANLAEARAMLETMQGELGVLQGNLSGNARARSSLSLDSLARAARDGAAAAAIAAKAGDQENNGDNGGAPAAPAPALPTPESTPAARPGAIETQSLANTSGNGTGSPAAGTTDSRPSPPPTATAAPALVRGAAPASTDPRDITRPGAASITRAATSANPAGKAASAGKSEAPGRNPEAADEPAAAAASNKEPAAGGEGDDYGRLSGAADSAGKDAKKAATGLGAIVNGAIEAAQPVVEAPAGPASATAVDEPTLFARVRSRLRVEESRGNVQQLFNIF